jgi:hypothetical protein
MKCVVEVGPSGDGRVMEVVRRQPTLTIEGVEGDGGGLRCNKAKAMSGSGGS